MWSVTNQRNIWFAFLFDHAFPQTIQRRLDEIEVTFKEQEEKGVELERVLRGEAGMTSHPSTETTFTSYSTVHTETLTAQILTETSIR